MAGCITAAIGIVDDAVETVRRCVGLYLTWLIGYSSLMGAIGGILIADYWVLRKRELSLADLFKTERAISVHEGE